jgi:hypothetical protein
MSFGGSAMRSNLASLAVLLRVDMRIAIDARLQGLAITW